MLGLGRLDLPDKYRDEDGDGDGPYIDDFGVSGPARKRSRLWEWVDTRGPIWLEGFCYRHVKRYRRYYSHKRIFVAE